MTDNIDDTDIITREEYKKIIAGLKDAIAYVQGDKSRGRVLRYNEEGQRVDENGKPL